MSIITRKAPLTLAERAAAASAKSAAALSIFVEAATDLDAAAEELDRVAHESAQEAEYKRRLAEDSENEAYDLRVRATAIRGIYEPTLSAFGTTYPTTIEKPEV